MSATGAALYNCIEIITENGDYIKIWRQKGRYAYGYYGDVYLLSGDKIREKVSN